MNARRRSFVRKMIYGLCLIPLASALYWLGHPATLRSETAEGSPGGVLAQERKEGGLDQVYLGKIDPTSETLKLATLGMRGIAANLLWMKGIEYQKKKDWTNLSATLNQIIKLQPNFIDVWRHQGWNLSYNCSAEFDDYRERYHWVIKGIEFLMLGTTYNEYEPRLLRDIGWFIGQKIGRSDEQKQFRRMFKDDDDFHGARPKNERDNWRVGKLWFRKAEKLIDTAKDQGADEAVLMRGMNPVVFRSEAAMCQMNYAAALEKDGAFGEKARNAWQQAAQDWKTFGEFPLPGPEDTVVRLGEFERLGKQRKDLLDKLDRLTPGIREKLHKERLSRLTDKQRKARATPEANRTPEQRGMAAEANELLSIQPHEIARNLGVPRANRPGAKQVLEQIQQLDNQLRITHSYRGVVNYEYWKRRAEIEQEQDLLTARELIYRGGKALAEGDLPRALDAFARGSANWASVLGQHPTLMADRATSDDIEDLLADYGKALDQGNELFPPDFALAPFVRMQVTDNPKMYLIRTNMEKAAEAQSAGEWGTAVAFYEKVLQDWKQVLVELPSLEQMSDPVTGEIILATIRQYADLMAKLKRPIPSDFVLHLFVRVQMEHDPKAEAAQTAAEQGEDALEKGDLAAARKAFEQSFTLWRQVLNRYPTLVADSTLGEELVAAIDQYRRLLAQQKTDMPKDFVLQDVLDRYGQGRPVPSPGSNNKP